MRRKSPLPIHSSYSSLPKDPGPKPPEEDRESTVARPEIIRAGWLRFQRNTKTSKIKWKYVVQKQLSHGDKLTFDKSGRKISALEIWASERDFKRGWSGLTSEKIIIPVSQCFNINRRGEDPYPPLSLSTHAPGTHAPPPPPMPPYHPIAIVHEGHSFFLYFDEEPEREVWLESLLESHLETGYQLKPRFEELWYAHVTKTFQTRSHRSIHGHFHLALTCQDVCLFRVTADDPKPTKSFSVPLNSISHFSHTLDTVALFLGSKCPLGSGKLEFTFDDWSQASVLHSAIYSGTEALKNQYDPETCLTSSSMRPRKWTQSGTYRNATVEALRGSDPFRPRSRSESNKTRPGALGPNSPSPRVNPFPSFSMRSDASARTEPGLSASSAASSTAPNQTTSESITPTNTGEGSGGTIRGDDEGEAKPCDLPRWGTDISSPRGPLGYSQGSGYTLMSPSSSTGGDGDDSTSHYLDMSFSKGDLPPQSSSLGDTPHYMDMAHSPLRTTPLQGEYMKMGPRSHSSEYLSMAPLLAPAPKPAPESSGQASDDSEYLHMTSAQAPLSAPEYVEMREAPRPADSHYVDMARPRRMEEEYLEMGAVPAPGPEYLEMSKASGDESGYLEMSSPASSGGGEGRGPPEPPIRSTPGGTKRSYSLSEDPGALDSIMAASRSFEVLSLDELRKQLSAQKKSGPASTPSDDSAVSPLPHYQGPGALTQPLQRYSSRASTHLSESDDLRSRSSTMSSTASGVQHLFRGRGPAPWELDHAAPRSLDSGNVTSLSTPGGEYVNASVMNSPSRVSSLGEMDFEATLFNEHSPAQERWKPPQYDSDCFMGLSPGSSSGYVSSLAHHSHDHGHNNGHFVSSHMGHYLQSHDLRSRTNSVGSRSERLAAFHPSRSRMTVTGQGAIPLPLQPGQRILSSRDLILHATGADREGPPPLGDGGRERACSVGTSSIRRPVIADVHPSPLPEGNPDEISLFPGPSSTRISKSWSESGRFLPQPLVPSPSPDPTPSPPLAPPEGDPDPELFLGSPGALGGEGLDETEEVAVATADHVDQVEKSHYYEERLPPKKKRRDREPSFRFKPFKMLRRSSSRRDSAESLAPPQGETAPSPLAAGAQGTVPSRKSSSDYSRPLLVKKLFKAIQGESRRATPLKAKHASSCSLPPDKATPPKDDASQSQPFTLETSQSQPFSLLLEANSKTRHSSAPSRATAPSPLPPARLSAPSGLHYATLEWVKATAQQPPLKRRLGEQPTITRTQYATVEPSSEDRLSCR